MDHCFLKMEGLRSLYHGKSVLWFGVYSANEKLRLLQGEGVESPYHRRFMEGDIFSNKLCLKPSYRGTGRGGAVVFIGRGVRTLNCSGRETLHIKRRRGIGTRRLFWWRQSVHSIWDGNQWLWVFAAEDQIDLQLTGWKINPSGEVPPTVIKLLIEALRQSHLRLTHIERKWKRKWNFSLSFIFVIWKKIFFGLFFYLFAFPSVFACYE